MTGFKIKKTLTTMVLVVATLAIGGCGGTETTAPTKAERDLQTRPLDLVMTDCSGSFKDGLAGFTGTLKAVTVDSATRGRRLWHGCFDGSPLRTLGWDPKVDFGDMPDSVEASGKVETRFTEARALGTVKKIERAIASTEVRVAGSGQLEALEVAAKTSDTGRVFMLTDLITFEVDGLILRKASDKEIRQTVSTWLPRLGDGLQGVQVFIVGYGLNAGSSRAARNAVDLFTDLITRAGGKVSITKDLPDRLVIGGGDR